MSLVGKIYRGADQGSGAETYVLPQGRGGNICSPSSTGAGEHMFRPYTKWERIV